MKNVLLQAAMKLNKGRTKKKWWQITVRVMAMVVVFCTTYALILPALTMEGEPVCGLEAHEHVESCYAQQTVLQFQCGLDGKAAEHSHGTLCYDAQGALICLLPEIGSHTHGDGCYNTVETVVTEAVLICEQSEAEAHAHADACYDAEGALICVLPETEGHVHADACYSTVENTVAETVVICGLAETVLHNHTEACLVETQQNVLICALPEHAHDETCYPQEEEDKPLEYLCGSGEHTHDEHCYTAEGTLGCTIPEHTHDAACVVADLDLTADVETPQQWEKELKKLEFTGNWPTDVLTVAQSQLDYKESTKNVVLENGKLKGYTRYGDWYGIPYGDWCAMYASFCLHYAGVEDFPVECEVNRWIDLLTEAELYRTSDAYAGKPGDVVFFDYDQKKDAEEEIPVKADHVGIVAEYLPATETEPAKVKTIEGNTGNRVAYRTYELDDPAIIGFGVVPAGKTTVLNYQGEDYSVTVSFTPEAGIPAEAQLAVQEILPGTDEYNTYYQQSVEAMLHSATAENEEELAVSFARFFDISFLVDGQAIEPLAAVRVQISYSDGIQQAEEESGVAVHFAEDGVEVLDAETSRSAQEEEDASQVDTFLFEQDSFSVVGTVMSSYARAVATTATRVQPNQIDGTGNTLYVLYTQIGSQYYALDGNGKAVQITVSGNTVNLGKNASDDLLWSFVSSGGNYAYNPIGNLGTGRYLHPFNNGGNDVGTTTANPYGVTLSVSNGTFKIRGAGNNYLYFANATSTSQPTTSTNQANNFYVAEAGKFYNVWFDGTNSGMMSYYGSDDLHVPVAANANGVATVTLPETWKSPTKYAYKLQGWYDINSQTYYPVDPTDDETPTATINDSTVFYADWIAGTYDVGVDNAHAVDSVDTDNFITTHVFDYNVLFNVLSQRHTGTISAAGHTEDWTILPGGSTVPYKNGESLNFAFVDYDADGEFSYARQRDNFNISRDTITDGILEEVMEDTGVDLLDLLFNPETKVIGKYYAGTGNYLFQYMDSTTENYDGVHDGYYYLDARLNAASYNQSEQRFYVYDYLERTSDSRKDGGAGQYSDFLPFNSPYLFDESQVDGYTDTIRRPGYEYDAKDGGTNYPTYNSLDDAATNYFFGIRTDIEFFLPNDTNTTDEYGNYGNISARGEHMVFDFHGDDDVWVFVDDELLLDIGGLHGVMFGQIDFSTGKVLVGKDGGDVEELPFHMSEGTHTMTVYYMERGSSQSNCAIYFNIAPRYKLELVKEDLFTGAKLNGAVFAIYNDEALSSPAQLWPSENAHIADMKDGKIDDATNTFTVVDGKITCWGVSAGKTYYVTEVTPPPGYPETDDIIRITVNNRGAASMETTTLNGINGESTEGFGVIDQDVDETLKAIRLTITNQQDIDTVDFRVQKIWAAGSDNLPESIEVFLTVDGVPVGRRAILNEGNGWSYTWTGLPKYATTGVDQEIQYEVQEVLVPNFITSHGERLKVEKYVDWVRAPQLSDSEIFLLIHNGQALTYTASGFGWMNPETAKLDTSSEAQWSVTTDHDGFHLKNGRGYTLTFRNNRFYGDTSDAVNLNQVFYYLNSRLVVHDHDVYYQLGNNGTAVADDGLAFTLYKKEVITGFITDITNRPVEEEKQTHVEVNKVWADGNDAHADASVVIHLYADGADTGRAVTLNAENNWMGSFHDLPYYQENGAKIEYTVVEDRIPNYQASYSDPVEIPGEIVDVWNASNALTANKTYRFVSGNYALSVDRNGLAVAALSNSSDTKQQWTLIATQRGNLLMNLSNGQYLYADADTAYTTSQNSASYVTLSSGNKLRVGSQYLEVRSTGIGTTTQNANATPLNILQKAQVVGQYGSAITVTNEIAQYTLPVTGGPGIIFFFTFGGLLMAVVALMYMCKFGRKRQRGGKFSRF